MRGKLSRLERTVTVAALAPFAVGALVPAHAVLDGPLLCPFQALTGAPCPLCGATRAVVLAAHLDARWLEYGAVWVVALAVLAVAGRRALRLAPVLATFVLAWAWALAHAGTITGSS